MAKAGRRDSSTDPPPSREALSAAMVRDAKGLRDLQEYLTSIKDFDDAAFADATGGADRAELMELLARLTGMLAELDELTTQIRTGPDRTQR